MTPFLFYSLISVWQLLIFGYIIQSWLELAEAKSNLQKDRECFDREKERFIKLQEKIALEPKSLKENALEKAA